MSAPKYTAEQLATNAASIKQLANGLVSLAADMGLVLTIEQRPIQPLAMGNYETVVSVRPARRLP
jgi:hypothetical protein